MKVFSVIDYGAKADGQTKDTLAFERAIAACAEAGGGRVRVPVGQYLTGPIRLRSHVELHLERDSLITFSRDFDDYPLVESDYEGEPCVRCLSPLSGEELVGIRITGEGTFDGQGEAWRPVKRWKMTDQQWADISRGGVIEAERDVWWPTQAAMQGEALIEKLKASGKPLSPRDYAPARDFLRPTLVKFSKCRDLVIDGPTFRNSPAWNVHLLLCEDVIVRNVTIVNPWFSSNGDGLDLDACRNVTVYGSKFDCGDDAICIKSGKNEAGRKRGRACENIVIENCQVLHGHGGVTIGSEMSGGVRNVRVHNCIFHGTDIGLRFKSTRGRGGVVENIEMSNVVMHDIKHDAISLNLYYWVQTPEPEPVSERTPVFRGIAFRNITCDGAGRAIEVRGLPESPIERVTFDNIRMSSTAGIVLSDARDVALSNVQVTATSAPAIHVNNVRGLKVDLADAAGPVEGLGGKRVGDL